MSAVATAMPAAEGRTKRCLLAMAICIYLVYNTLAARSGRVALTRQQGQKAMKEQCGTS